MFGRRRSKRGTGIDNPARADFDAYLGGKYDEMATTVAHSCGTGFTDLAAPVLAAVHKDLPYPVWCGLEPTSAYSAFARRTDNGAIILVSTGYLTAVVDFVHLLIRQVRLDASDPIPVTPLDPDAARAHLAAIVAGALSPSTVMVPPPGALPGRLVHTLPPIGGLRAKLADILIASTVRFAVAHELAHVIQGHLDRPSARAEPGSTELNDERRWALNFVLDWQEEMDADLHGLRVVLRLPSEHWEDPYYGLVVFADLTDAILDAAQPATFVAKRAWSTHPHPILRRSAAIVSVHPDELRAKFPMCEPLVAAIDELRDGPIGRRDPAALEAIGAWADQADLPGLELLLYGGDSVEGVRFIDVSAVEARVSVDFQWARTAVSWLIARAITSGKVAGASFGVHAGVFYAAFCRTQLARGTEEARAFDRLLRAAVPELDRIISVASEGSMSVDPQER